MRPFPACLVLLDQFTDAALPHTRWTTCSMSLRAWTSQRPHPCENSSRYYGSTGFLFARSWSAERTGIGHHAGLGCYLSQQPQATRSLPKWGARMPDQVHENGQSRLCRFCVEVTGEEIGFSYIGLVSAVRCAGRLGHETPSCPYRG